MTSPLTIDAFLGELFDPAKALTHIPYMLLVVSMLMRDMGWLRAFAITAGVIRIFNRTFIDQDFIVAFWELMLVCVNVGHLMMLWYYAKRARFSDDEKVLIANLDPSVSRRTVRRLLRLGTWRSVEPETVLIEEGRPVTNLVFVAEGLAQVERGDRIIAVCGAGDFLGEMSFVSGKPANATVRTARPGRILSFPQSALRQAMRNDEDLRQAVESGLNRNLVGKLAKSG